MKVFARSLNITLTISVFDFYHLNLEIKLTYKLDETTIVTFNLQVCTVECWQIWLPLWTWN